MKAKYKLVLMLLALLSFNSYADRIETVSAEFTFYGDGNHSRDECMRLALEGAKIEALRSKFGTIVCQDIVTDNRLTNGAESSFFSSMSSSQVKGEWIADEGEPQYTFGLDNDGNLIVTCKMSGKARALSNESVDFDVMALRNGSDARFAETSFKDGDELRLLLKTPVDGYAAAYLLGEDNMAYSLLPYLNSSSGEVKLRHSREYVFFDTEHGDNEFGPVDELVLTAGKPLEFNSLYVVFSPNNFSRASDDYKDELTPRSLPFKNFFSWLTKSRSRDPKMSVKVINLRISE